MIMNDHERKRHYGNALIVIGSFTRKDEVFKDVMSWARDNAQYHPTVILAAGWGMPSEVIDARFVRVPVIEPESPVMQGIRSAYMAALAAACTGKLTLLVYPGKTAELETEVAARELKAHGRAFSICRPEGGEA